MSAEHDLVSTLRMFDSVMMNKAADEIERLRALTAGAGAMSDTRSTLPQRLREVADGYEEIEELVEAAYEIDRLWAERDAMLPPSPGTPAGQQPLSEETLLKLWIKAWGVKVVVKRDPMLHYARAIEREHGITPPAQETP